MTIESIEEISKARYSVTLSDGTVWRLYGSDLRRFHLKSGELVSEALYDEITHTCITVRARKKVLALLEKMDRPEQDLRMRLLRAGYTEEQADDALSYAKQYGYIDDSRYAKNYVKSKSTTKSRKQIELELRQKGIHSRDIQDLYEEAGGEEEAIRRLICRKAPDIDSMTYEEKQKIAASLFRKGFPSELIRRELRL